MGEVVNNICELKKEQLIIINISKKSQEEINIYQKLENDLQLLFSVTEDKEILNLIELKNGNLLLLKKHQIKIYDIDKNQMQINKIQEINSPDYPNELYKGIKELINGYLISISFYKDKTKDNKIIFLEKKLFNKEYEIIGYIKIKEKPIDILEVNDKNFLILFENNNLYMFDSNTGKGEKKFLYKLNNNSPYKRMIQVEDNGILFINLNSIYLLNIKTLLHATAIKRILINDICYIDNLKNKFLVSYINNGYYGLLLLNTDLSKNEVYEIKEAINNNLNFGIKCMKLLSDGHIITASNDNTVKIIKILKKISDMHQ